MVHVKSYKDEYFDWMYDLVCKDRFSGDISYRKLLYRLHQTEFRYSIRNDFNRAEDGFDLRRRYAMSAPDPRYISDSLAGPCTVLEMMVALSIRCEEQIMDNPRFGDRTTQWFWSMVVNLGLGAVSDEQYDEEFVDGIIKKFLDREYSSDGRGGLFRVRHCKRDLRDVEIWHQLCWYLDSIS